MCIRDSLSICARHGVNRLSIGVQSFEEGLLRRMNRSHDAAQIEAAIARARAHGIENLSIDLIYGLPGQTLDMWLADLQKATALPITHISLYSLTIEENSAFGRMGVLAADDELEYQMYAAAIDDPVSYTHLPHLCAGCRQSAAEAAGRLYQHLICFSA